MCNNMIGNRVRQKDKGGWKRVGREIRYINFKVVSYKIKMVTGAECPGLHLQEWVSCDSGTWRFQMEDGICEGSSPPNTKLFGHL